MTTQKASILTFFIFTLLFSLTSQAKIYIVIDQHDPEKKFPIAVPNLVPIKISNDKENLSGRLAEILRNDLKIAGLFEVLPPSNYPENPGSSLTKEEIDFKRWAGIGTQALVKGGVSLEGKNIVLQMRLFDAQTGEMLVGKEYKVDRKNPRQAIHRFMDEIMLALTGEKGVFSTRIVAACGKVGQREIAIMDVDGENQTPITKNGSVNVSPAWSPDGTQVIFTSYAKYFPELFIASTDGKGKPKRITFNNSMNITPAWGPDNSGIAMASSMGGDPEIYLIDPQGNKLAQLTRNFGIDLAPTWSPDSQRIAFASERNGGLHLFSMDRNGNDVKRLTYSNYQNDQPDWSPKGDRIAYASRGGHFDIYTMNPDGSQIQQLTHGPGNSESPSFSPDGRYIVFSRTQNYKTDLYIMLWDGSSQTRITQNGDCVNPDWSPWLN